MIDVKKGEPTLRVRTEEVHFNLNQSLKQLDFERAQCIRIDNVILDSQEINSDFVEENPLEECMFNSLYNDELDKEKLNEKAELIESVMSQSEENDDNLRSNEVKG